MTNDNTSDLIQVPDTVAYDIATAIREDKTLQEAAVRVRRVIDKVMAENQATIDAVNAQTNNGPLQISRKLQNQFYDEYCLNKPDLVSCAQSAFYTANKELTRLQANNTNPIETNSAPVEPLGEISSFIDSTESDGYDYIFSAYQKDRIAVGTKLFTAPSQSVNEALKYRVALLTLRQLNCVDQSESAKKIIDDALINADTKDS